MISIFGILSKVWSDDSNLINRSIAKNLLLCFKTGNFYNQKELADIIHSSESSITVFAKKINLSGYRELMLRARIEYEKLTERINEINVSDVLTYKPSMIVQEFIQCNSHIIQKLAQHIDSGKKILFFSHYQLLSRVEDFVNTLKWEGPYNIDLYDPTSKSGYYTELIKNSDDFIKVFVFTSTSDDINKWIYEECYNRKPENVFVISSTSKTLFNSPNNIILTLDSEFSHVMYRRYVLDTILLELMLLIRKIKSTS